MKLLKLISVVFLLVVLLFPTMHVYAQTSENQVNYSKSYDLYRSEYEEYIKAHDQYVLSKKQFEQYNTLSAKEKLQSDLSLMLVKRDTVLVLYYETLKSRILDNKLDLTDDKRNEKIEKLNGEISWLNEHTKLYQSNSSPQTLSERSDETDMRYKDFSIEIYNILYLTARGKILAYNGRFNSIYNDLYSLTERIKTEQREAYKLSDSKIETINRWFGEINVKNEDFTEFLDKAELQIEGASLRNLRGSYINSINTLAKALGVLSEKISNSMEIVNQIKIAEN